MSCQPGVIAFSMSNMVHVDVHNIFIVYFQTTSSSTKNFYTLVVSLQLTPKSHFKLSPSGKGMYIRFSNLLRSASSISHGWLVAARTITSFDAPPTSPIPVKKNYFIQMSKMALYTSMPPPKCLVHSEISPVKSLFCITITIKPEILACH